MEPLGREWIAGRRIHQDLQHQPSASHEIDSVRKGKERLTAAYRLFLGG